MCWLLKVYPAVTHFTSTNILLTKVMHVALTHVKGHNVTSHKPVNGTAIYGRIAGGRMGLWMDRRDRTKYKMS